MVISGTSHSMSLRRSNLSKKLFYTFCIFLYLFLQIIIILNLIYEFQKTNSWFMDGVVKQNIEICLGFVLQVIPTRVFLLSLRAWSQFQKCSEEYYNTMSSSTLINNFYDISFRYLQSFKSVKTRLYFDGRWWNYRHLGHFKIRIVVK